MPWQVQNEWCREEDSSCTFPMIVRARSIENWAFYSSEEEPGATCKVTKVMKNTYADYTDSPMPWHFFIDLTCKSNINGKTSTIRSHWRLSKNRLIVAYNDLAIDVYVRHEAVGQ
jgi:hypothetical protein